MQEYLLPLLFLFVVPLLTWIVPLAKIKLSKAMTLSESDARAKSLGTGRWVFSLEEATTVLLERANFYQWVSDNGNVGKTYYLAENGRVITTRKLQFRNPYAALFPNGLRDDTLFMSLFLSNFLDDPIKLASGTWVIEQQFPGNNFQLTEVKGLTVEQWLRSAGVNGRRYWIIQDGEMKFVPKYQVPPVEASKEPEPSKSVNTDGRFHVISNPYPMVVDLAGKLAPVFLKTLAEAKATAADLNKGQAVRQPGYTLNDLPRLDFNGVDGTKFLDALNACTKFPAGFYPDQLKSGCWSIYDCQHHTSAWTVRNGRVRYGKEGKSSKKCGVCNNCIMIIKEGESDYWCPVCADHVTAIPKKLKVPTTYLPPGLVFGNNHEPDGFDAVLREEFEAAWKKVTNFPIDFSPLEFQNGNWTLRGSSLFNIGSNPVTAGNEPTPCGWIIRGGLVTYGWDFTRPGVRCGYCGNIPYQTEGVRYTWMKNHWCAHCAKYVFVVNPDRLAKPVAQPANAAYFTIGDNREAFEPYRMEDQVVKCDFLVKAEVVPEVPAELKFLSPEMRAKFAEDFSRVTNLPPDFDSSRLTSQGWAIKDNRLLRAPSGYFPKMCGCWIIRSGLAVFGSDVIQWDSLCKKCMAFLHRVGDNDPLWCSTCWKHVDELPEEQSPVPQEHRVLSQLTYHGTITPEELKAMLKASTKPYSFRPELLLTGCWAFWRNHLWRLSDGGAVDNANYVANVVAIRHGVVYRIAEETPCPDRLCRECKSPTWHSRTDTGSPGQWCRNCVKYVTIALGFRLEDLPTKLRDPALLKALNDCDSFPANFSPDHLATGCWSILDRKLNRATTWIADRDHFAIRNSRVIYGRDTLGKACSRCGHSTHHFPGVPNSSWCEKCYDFVETKGNEPSKTDHLDPSRVPPHLARPEFIRALEVAQRPHDFSPEQLATGNWAILGGRLVQLPRNGLPGTKEAIWSVIKGHLYNGAITESRMRCTYCKNKVWNHARPWCSCCEKHRPYSELCA